MFTYSPLAAQALPLHETMTEAWHELAPAGLCACGSPGLFWAGILADIQRLQASSPGQIALLHLHTAIVGWVGASTYCVAHA